MIPHFFLEPIPLLLLRQIELIQVDFLAVLFSPLDDLLDLLPCCPAGLDPPDGSGVDEIVFGGHIGMNEVFTLDVGKVVIVELGSGQEIQFRNPDVVMEVVGVGVLHNVNVVFIGTVAVHQLADILFDDLSGFLPIFFTFWGKLFQVERDHKAEIVARLVVQ